jgi:hypothetical protein
MEVDQSAAAISTTTHDPVRTIHCTMPSFFSHFKRLIAARAFVSLLFLPGRMRRAPSIASWCRARASTSIRGTR